jgi:two-component system nitrogen regulation sensor histidine kinase NtrY
LLGQALTNLLQNAADGILMRPIEAAGTATVPGNVQMPAQVTAQGTVPATNSTDGGLAGRLRGTIWIAIRENNKEISISVADDGIGLPQTDRLRLTEPYVTHKPKGTGLGLAIVKKIMEDHGGSITLDDRTEGRGAIAILSLPAPIHEGGQDGA